MAYYALKKDVFDKSKITVVGNPSISDDGVASGLNVDNYIVPFSDITLGDDFEMYLPFKLTSIMSSRQLFYRGQYGSRFAFLLGADSKIIRFNFRSSTMSLSEFVIIPNVELNIDYIVKLKLKNGLLSYGYFKNNTYTHVGELETTLVMDNINWFRFGGATNTSAIINMPEFKIYINGQLAYSPTKPTYLLERRKEGYDPSKFTIVGSPTITEYGVASGFSSKSSGTENYLTFPTVFNPENKPWKIVIKATIGEWVSGSPYKSLLGTGIQGRDNQGVALALGTGNSIACWLSSTGTGWNIGTIRAYFPDIIGNTYYFKIEFTGTKYVLSVSQDNKNWDIKGSIESTTPIYVSSQPLAIGDNKYNNAASTCWTGSIDLPSTSITVGGKEVFTGAKEVYYAMEK